MDPRATFLTTVEVTHVFTIPRTKQSSICWRVTEQEYGNLFFSESSSLLLLFQIAVVVLLTSADPILFLFILPRPGSHVVLRQPPPLAQQQVYSAPLYSRWLLFGPRDLCNARRHAFVLSINTWYVQENSLRRITNITTTLCPWCALEHSETRQSAH